jgi:hypothetical protein
VKDVPALIILLTAINFLVIAEACRARLWIQQAVVYYWVAFALSGAFVCGALGAIFF